MNYTSGGVADGNALLSFEAGFGARTLAITNVAFTGVHSGWNGNGNKYFSIFGATPGAANVNLTLASVNVSITGQGNSFNETTGGSAFLHS